jgi:molybdopterin-binding protein
MLVVIVEVLVVEAELRRVVNISSLVAGNLETVTVETTRGGDVLGDVPLVVTRVVARVGDGSVVVAVITSLTVDELKLDLLALEAVPLELVLLAAGHGLTVTRAVDTAVLRRLVAVRPVVIAVIIVLTIVVLSRVVIRVRISLGLAVVAVLGRGRVVGLRVLAVLGVVLGSLVSTAGVGRSVAGGLLVVVGLLVAIVVVTVGRGVVITTLVMAGATGVGTARTAGAGARATWTRSGSTWARARTTTWSAVRRDILARDIANRQAVGGKLA